MTLQQLAYFIAAERHGSFSAAADALHLAQPSLSDQIRRLEEELGVDLFARSTRGLVLTDAGRAFRPEAEATLAAADQARQAVASVREVRTGTAALGMFGNAPHELVADVVEAFHAGHPEVRLRLIGENSSEVAERVREGELEAALVSLPIDDSGLDVRPVWRHEVLYVSAHERRTRRRMTIERLARAPLVLYDARYRADDPARRLLRERAQRAGVSIEPLFEVEEVEAALEIAARGLADTVVMHRGAADPRFARRLYSTPFADPLHDTFAFITRRGAHPSPATRELVALAEAKMSTVPEAKVSMVPR
jgi:DNA-binding transcriptional LysR family regulator